MKNATVIVNPKAGKNRGQTCGNLAAARLRERGLEVLVLETTQPKEATELAKGLPEDCDVVFAVGGDGTVTEVVCGLVGHKSPPLGIIPVGTANVVARELKIPLSNPEGAVDAALDGEARHFDLPRANGSPFLANIGAGFDADVVHALHAHRQSLPEKRSISMVSYVPIGLGALWNHSPARLTVVVDGKKLVGEFADVVVCNTANYGGILSLTPDASPQDGKLDIYLRRRRGRAGIIRHLASAQFRWKDHRAVQRLQGTKIQVTASTDVALQIDGDPAGQTPVEISLGDDKITILAPA